MCIHDYTCVYMCIRTYGWMDGWMDVCLPACLSVHAGISSDFTEPMPPWPLRNGSSSKHSLEVQGPGPVSS